MAMEHFNDLNLIRDSIFSSLSSIAVDMFGEEVGARQVETKNGVNIEFSSANLNCVIAAYYKSNGTTSLVPQGKDKEKAKKMLELFVSSANFDDRKNISLATSDLDDEKFAEMMEFLTSDEVSAHIKSDENGASYRKMLVEGKQGDSITIKRFSNKNTQFQGKPVSLYRDIVYFLSGTSVANAAMNAEIELRGGRQAKKLVAKHDFSARFHELFPKSEGLLPDILKNLMLPSFAAYDYDGDLSDWTLFVFPILRGLEGYLKKLFLEKKLPVGKEGFGQYFNKGKGGWSLRENFRAQIGGGAHCGAIEKAYAFYNAQRHSLFHVDPAILPTRILKTREEAVDLIERTARIIDEGCFSIKEEASDDV